MKNCISFFFISFLFASIGAAQVPFWHQTNGPEAGTLSDMTIDSSGNVIVWTYGSGVYRSLDNGSTWQLLNKGMPSLNMKRGASGPSGYLFAINRYNQTFRFNENFPTALWEEITPNRDTIILTNDILADPNGAVYLATANGILRSDDNGLTWNKKNINLRDSITKKKADSNARFLAIDGNGNLFAALEFGGIFRSSNKGDTWTKLQSRDPEGQQISAIVAEPNGNIIVGNLGYRGLVIGGNIYVSSDTGRTWDSVYHRPETTPEVKNDIDKIVRIPGSDFLYANAHGITLRSINNGYTWNVMDSDKRGDEPFSMGVYKNNIFQMSEPDGIFLSNDQGFTWSAKNSGLLAQNMYDIAINSKQELFGITEYGLHRSTNNGDTWDQAPEYGETYFPSIYIDQKDFLYIGTSYGLFRSKDNGNSLSHIVINLDTSLKFNIIIQVGKDRTGSKLYCSSILADLGFIYSTDDGDSWAKVTGLEAASVSAFAFASQDTILVADNGSNYYRSINNGQTWDLISSNNNGTYQLLINSDGSYLSRVKNGGNEGIYRSTDGAQTWNKIFPPSSDFPSFTQFFSMMIDHDGRIIVCTDSGIYRSSENKFFNTWSAVSTGMTANDFPNHYISAAGVVENPVTHVFYAASRGLSVFKSIPDLNGVSDYSEPVVSSFNIQASPNPFSASTNISFRTKHSSNLTLEVYDVLGRLVKTLYNGIADQTEQLVSFDGSSLPSGSYLLSLSDGRNTSTLWVTLTR